MTNIPALQDAIKRLHGCESEHERSIPVTEQFQGKTVWQGTVEVFALKDHPKAQRCYAWSYRKDDGAERYTAVLHLPPIDSARKAVQIAIAAEAKKS